MDTEGGGGVIVGNDIAEVVRVTQGRHAGEVAHVTEGEGGRELAHAIDGEEGESSMASDELVELLVVSEEMV